MVHWKDADNGDKMTVVCDSPENCPEGIVYERHGASAGGTVVHMPPDGKVIPGLFDHGVPSDVPLEG